MAEKTDYGKKARDIQGKAKASIGKTKYEAAVQAVKGAQGSKPTDKPPTTPTPPPASGNYEDYLSGDNRDAFLVLKNLFNSYGLPTLAPKIYEFITKGYSADTIGILLQETPEYKQRFAANEQRKKAGLPVLSPQEYLQTEQAYRQYFRQAGLPEGFYDQPDDFTQFLGKDVSPTEVQSRVELASQATALANPAYKKALNEIYGIDDSALTAYFLDPNRAVPLLQKQAAAAAIGAEAMKRGLTYDKNQLETYASSGINAQQAGQIYASIAENQQGFQQVAQSFQEDLSQKDLEQALFTPGASAPGQESSSGKLNRLQSWQRARIGGQAGGAQSGLARRSG